MDATRAAREELDFGAVAEAMQLRLPSYAHAAIGPIAATFAERFGELLAPKLRDVLQQAGLVASAGLPPGLVRTEPMLSRAASGAVLRTADMYGFSFDADSPGAARWAREHSAELVQQVSDETRDALRVAMEQAYMEHLEPARSAKLIEDIVGLDQRRAEAVLNLRAELLAQELSQRDIDRQATAYAEQLLGQRAIAIARTETSSIAQAAQQQMWAQAVEEGLILPEDYQGEWLISDGEACDDCKAMIGERRPLSGTYEGGVLSPLHTNCECGEILVELTDEEKQLETDDEFDEAYFDELALPEGELMGEAELATVPDLASGVKTVVMGKTEKEMAAALNEAMADIQLRFPSLGSKRMRLKRLELKYLEVLDHQIADINMKAAGLYYQTKKKIVLATKRISNDIAPKYGSWTVCDGVVKTFRHEFGHHVHFVHIGLDSWTGEPKTKAAEAWRAIWSSRQARVGYGKWEGTWEQVISKYGATNERELFAEAFAAYSNPKYVAGSLPREVEAYMQKYVGRPVAAPATAPLGTPIAPVSVAPPPVIPVAPPIAVLPPAPPLLPPVAPPIPPAPPVAPPGVSRPLTADDVIRMRQMRESGMSLRAIGDEYAALLGRNFAPGYIHQICSRQIWKGVP